MIRSTVRTLGLLVVFPLVVGCASDSGAPAGSDKQDDAPGDYYHPVQHLPSVPDSFTLFVSNQSFEFDPIYVQVELDGQRAVEGDFLVERQHTWLEFDFQLAAGTHTIRVTSPDVNDLVLEQQFEMVDRKWAVVDFWYYGPTHYHPTPPKFTAMFLDYPPSFF